MKKFLTLACALGAVVLASSCQDEDFGADSSAIAFNSQFEKTFGKVSADQSWDFYAMQLNQNNGTRAITGFEVGGLAISTLSSDIVNSALALVPDNNYNGDQGTQATAITSTGDFNIYTCKWGGDYETDRNRNFVAGIEVTYDGETQKAELFTVKNYRDNKKSQLMRPIKMPAGAKIRFYISYYNTNNQYETRYSDGTCRVLVDQYSGDTRTMIFAFEDQFNSKTSDGKEPDYNDFVFCLTGNLPTLDTKRFMCEDLSGAYQTSILIDYNDLVFDVHPLNDKTTEVYLRAAGGTLPITLTVGGKAITADGKTEIHEILGGKSTTDSKGNTIYSPINVETKGTAVKVTIGLDLTAADALTNFTNVIAHVTYLDKTSKDITYHLGSAPEIITTGFDTKWMKEDKCISTGYKNFYKDGWYNTVSDVSALVTE